MEKLREDGVSKETVKRVISDLYIPAHKDKSECKCNRPLVPGIVHQCGLDGPEKKQNQPKHETVEQWISVEDRLPEDDNEVLIYATGDYYWLGRYDKCDWFETFEGELLEDDSEDIAVTHWQPLPPPPLETQTSV